jgi:hypothetical protein
MKMKVSCKTALSLAVVVSSGSLVGTAAALPTGPSAADQPGSEDLSSSLMSIGLAHSPEEIARLQDVTVGWTIKRLTAAGIPVPARLSSAPTEDPAALWIGPSELIEIAAAASATDVREHAAIVEMMTEEFGLTTDRATRWTDQIQYLRIVVSVAAHDFEAEWAGAVFDHVAERLTFHFTTKTAEQRFISTYPLRALRTIKTIVVPATLKEIIDSSTSVAKALWATVIPPDSPLFPLVAVGEDVANNGVMLILDPSVDEKSKAMLLGATLGLTKLPVAVEVRRS